MMNIVLLEPEIALNTGNIGRTCAATKTRLHLIYPLGFSISEKAVKRAGLDYWDKVDLRTYADFEEFLEEPRGRGKADKLSLATNCLIQFRLQLEAELTHELEGA